MPFPHTADVNEDVPAIAAKYGFSKWEKVWALDENKPLREQGRSPFALRAGDVVHVPEPTSKPKKYSTESTHDVKVKRMWFDLEVAFVDAFHEPLKNREYEFTRDKMPMITGTTDDKGVAKLKVGAHSKKGEVLFKNPDGKIHLKVNLRFGEMDPMGSKPATEKMLRNLGFWVYDDLADAVSRFQVAVGLRATGKADPQTLTWIDLAYREGVEKTCEKVKDANQAA